MVPTEEQIRACAYEIYEEMRCQTGLDLENWLEAEAELDKRVARGDEPLFHKLVVEDNPADITLLRMAIEQAGLNVMLTVLKDGADALSFIRQQGCSR